MFGLLESQSASSYLVAADIHLEDVVKISEEKGRIVIEPIRSKTYDVNDLVKPITSRNLHEPTDFGRPEGGEVW
jgi:antitoxin MazE